MVPKRQVFGVALAFVAAMVGGCKAGWLNPSQPGFVIQTFTTYDPITGNNSGTITTNGNSYQFAGDNTGAMFLGGPGAQFRGKNDGAMRIDGEGAFVLGSFASLSTVTNRGKGSLLLGNLSAGQRATITDVGNAAILIGAGTVSNGQCVVVGDGMESHGIKSVTAGSFWGLGAGFYGNGGGLTNVPPDPTRMSLADGAVLSNRITALENGGTGTFATIYGYTNGLDTRTIVAQGWVSRTYNFDEQEIVDVSGVYTQVATMAGVYLWVCGSRVGSYSVRVVNGPPDNFTIETWVGDDNHVSTDPLCRGTAVPGSCTPAGRFDYAHVTVGYGTKAYPATLADGNGLQGGALAPATVSSNKLAADVWTAVDDRAGAVGAGRFALANGTQLVFVVGTVTNVIDADILHP